MKFLIKLFILCFAFYLAVANGKDRTGTIESVERNRIVLKFASGGTTHIGFLCEPEVCKSMDNFKIGDEVLATFDAVEGKNRLLDIRLCIQDDTECQKVAEEEEKRRELHKSASEKSFKNTLECQVRMEKELKKDIRFPSENWFGRFFLYDQYQDEYLQMLKDPKSRECVKSVSEAQFDVFIEICQKHGCGDNVGGGCYHIGGYRSFDATQMHAVKQCR